MAWQVPGVEPLQVLHAPVHAVWQQIETPLSVTQWPVSQSSSSEQVLP